jgi:hypothetical protein
MLVTSWYVAELRFKLANSSSKVYTHNPLVCLPWVDSQKMRIFFGFM